MAPFIGAMAKSLDDRQKEYENAYDIKIINRIPIIIRIDGKNFHHVTRRLEKPYCPSMLNLMATTMLGVVREIDGAVFGYQQSDEITIVVRNDQSLETQPWYGNRVQKIVSISAALATFEFSAAYLNLDHDERPNLAGKIIFDARVFAVPTVGEVVNNLIFRQQDCIRNALNNATSAELTKLHGKKAADKILHEKSSLEREELLHSECGIVFSTHYPAAYRHGIAAYKAPRIIDTEVGQITRNRWILDRNLPKFSEDRNFALDIINFGHDIFRANRDLSSHVVF